MKDHVATALSKHAEGEKILRQAALNVVTICDMNPNWVTFHLPRFLRLAKRAMPYAKYYLVLCCDDGRQMCGGVTGLLANDLPLLNDFDQVHYVKTDKEQPGYLFFNDLRFSLLERFGLDECLYVDADVDIMADISDIPAMSRDAQLMYCISPITPQGFEGLMRLVGVSAEPPYVNAGMLYLRKDLQAEYRRAAQLAVQAQFNPRMIGNASFNIMQRMLPAEAQHEIPYTYGLIWWDKAKSKSGITVEVSLPNGPTIASTCYAAAKALHFCNDHGKQERIRREKEWIWA
jgi:hypothetical protein